MSSAPMSATSSMLTNRYEDVMPVATIMLDGTEYFFYTSHAMRSEYYYVVSKTGGEISKKHEGRHFNTCTELMHTLFGHNITRDEVSDILAFSVGDTQIITDGVLSGGVFPISETQEGAQLKLQAIQKFAALDTDARADLVTETKKAIASLRALSEF